MAKNNEWLLWAGLAVAGYFIVKNYSKGESFASNVENAYIAAPNQQPPTSPPAPTTQNNYDNARGSGKASGGGGGRSMRNNVYDRTSGTIMVNQKGYSVAPEKVGRLITQATISDAQSVYTRKKINPYGGL